MAAGVAREALVQVAYAIGVAAPVSLYVNTNGTAAPGLTDAMISQKVAELVDMRPAAIEKRLKLRSPIYAETASFGHMGREPHKVIKHFSSNNNPKRPTKSNSSPGRNLISPTPSGKLSTSNNRKAFNLK